MSTDFLCVSRWYKCSFSMANQTDTRPSASGKTNNCNQARNVLPSNPVHANTAELGEVYDPTTNPTKTNPTKTNPIDTIILFLTHRFTR